MSIWALVIISSTVAGSAPTFHLAKVGFKTKAKCEQVASKIEEGVIGKGYRVKVSCNKLEVKGE